MPNARARPAADGPCCAHALVSVPRAHASPGHTLGNRGHLPPSGPPFTAQRRQMVLKTDKVLLSNQRLPRGAPGTHVHRSAAGKGSFLKHLDLERWRADVKEKTLPTAPPTEPARQAAKGDGPQMGLPQPFPGCILPAPANQGELTAPAHGAAPRPPPLHGEPGLGASTFLGMWTLVRAACVSWERQRGDRSCPPPSPRELSMNASLSSLLESSSSHSSSEGSVEGEQGWVGA